MLCAMCSSFTTDVWNKDFATWRRVDECLFTFKHGNYYEILASGKAGCDVCHLLHTVREQRMPGYSALGHKWLCKWASVDVLYQEEDSPPSFKLITIAPEKPFLEFEYFDLRHYRSTADLPVGGTAWRISKHIQDAAVPLASKWLGVCASTHTVCQRDRDSSFPTRVIDVGPKGSTVDPKLCDNTGKTLDPGRIGGYAVLSHCWGTSRRLVTTQANVAEHLDVIPMCRLPATFRDAITMTRGLGIRYLWVDALCIIQDSAKDWEHEAATMDETFSNAVLSLSALDSEDSHTGFLHDRLDCHAVIELSGVIVGVRPKLLSVEEGISTSKLETRAWCMQEKLLPRAVLHFGREQLYWRCFASEASEARPSSDPAALYLHPLRALTDVTREHDFNDIWLDLVEQYSERLLTKPSDRLPALRGLARYYSKVVDREYHHGLWDKDSCARLLWQRSYWHVKAPFDQERPPEARLAPSKIDALKQAEQAGDNKNGAPSWSWASVNRPVNWSWRSISPVRVPSSLDATINMNYQKRLDDSGLQCLLSTHDDNFNPKGAIHFDAHLRRGTCKIISDLDTGQESAVFFVSGGRKDEISCVLDRSAGISSMSCYGVFVAQFGPSGTPKRSDTGLSSSSTGSGRFKRFERSEEDRGYVLLLSGTRSETGEVFGYLRRIGVGYGAAENVQRMFEDSPRSKIVIW